MNWSSVKLSEIIVKMWMLIMGTLLLFSRVSGYKSDELHIILKKVEPDFLNMLKDT